MLSLYNLLTDNVYPETSIKDLVPRINQIIRNSVYIEELRPWIEYRSAQYTKIRVLPYSKNELFDIYVISWLPGQKTPIHGHPAHGCIMTLLSGELTETLYTSENELLQTRSIRPMISSYIADDIGYHSIECIEKAVSLHIYAPSPFVA